MSFSVLRRNDRHMSGVALLRMFCLALEEIVRLLLSTRSSSDAAYWAATIARSFLSTAFS